MDGTNKTLLLSVIIVFGLLYSITAFVLLQDETTLEPTTIKVESTALQNERITVTVTDQFGEVIDQKTGKNAIVNTGENCIAKMLWSDPTDAGDQTCEGATNDAWRYFCLDEDEQVLIVDKDLRNAADEAGLSTCQKAAITWNQNSTASTDALSKVDVRLSYTFTNSGADESICSVGVFNGSAQSTRSMMSKGNFTGGCVTVTAGSDLTVNYDYEYGGGTVP